MHLMRFFSTTPNSTTTEKVGCRIKHSVLTVFYFEYLLLLECLHSIFFQTEARLLRDVHLKSDETFRRVEDMFKALDAKFESKFDKLDSKIADQGAKFSKEMDSKLNHQSYKLLVWGITSMSGVATVVAGGVNYFGYHFALKKIKST